MKLITDIPDEHYRTLQEAMKNHMESLIGKIILNGTPIPDNATNADVIRTLFPDGIPKDIVWTLQGDKGADWWNAPYQKGGKE